MSLDRVTRLLAEGPAPEAGEAETWQMQVHNLMRAGFGAEDIALRLGCLLADVERERDILRAEGRLDALYTGRPAPEPSASELARNEAFLRRVAQEVAWALKAKGQMTAKRLSRARKACPRCGGTVHLSLQGRRGHVHAACETPSCLRVIE